MAKARSDPIRSNSKTKLGKGEITCLDSERIRKELRSDKGIKGVKLER